MVHVAERWQYGLALIEMEARLYFCILKGWYGHLTYSDLPRTAGAEGHFSASSVFLSAHGVG